VGNNFDDVVNNFTFLEELTYISQDFIQIEQNFKKLKHLRKFKIECEISDDVVVDLKNEFSF